MEAPAGHAPGHRHGADGQASLALPAVDGISKLLGERLSAGRAAAALPGLAGAFPVVRPDAELGLSALLLTPFAPTQRSWPTSTDMLPIAEVGVLSPLVYLELATATLIGVVVFAKLPDILAFAGIGLIMLGGWLVWRLERVKGIEPSS